MLIIFNTLLKTKLQIPIILIVECSKALISLLKHFLKSLYPRHISRTATPLCVVVSLSLLSPDARNLGSNSSTADGNTSCSATNTANTCMPSVRSFYDIFDRWGNVITIKCTWWRWSARDDNKVHVMTTKCKWWQQSARGDNKVYMMTTKWTWWQQNTRDDNNLSTGHDAASLWSAICKFMMYCMQLVICK